MIDVNRADGPVTFVPVTATGTTDYLRIMRGAATHTIQATTSGTDSGSTYRLEGSLDGNNFYDISGTITGMGMTHIVSKVVPFVRVNVLTFSDTGSITFSYMGACPAW